MERLITIIKINSKALDDELDDLKRFNQREYFGIMYQIPKVIVLKQILHKKHEFIEKPLLFNYGFLEMPLEYAKNPTVLQDLRQVSRLIQGFFRRTPGDLELERILAKADGLANYRPVLVKTITPTELERLVQVSKEINVYDSLTQLEPGNYIVLKGYPFEGMGAVVLDITKAGKLHVRLIESGITVHLEPNNIYYSAYNEEDILSA